MANKADDTHNKEDIDIKVENLENKVDDIHKYLVRSKRSATRSDTVTRQEMPLKPEVCYERDNFVEEITLFTFLGRNLSRVHSRPRWILRRIAKLSRVAILVTMRGRCPPCDKAIK